MITTEELERLKVALEGYRAAVRWIGADSWDGCSECMAWLKAAAAADWTFEPWTPDEHAAALKRLYPHKPIAARAALGGADGW